MKSLIIATMVSILSLPALAEEQKSPFNAAEPGAAGAAIVGLGVHSIYKDGKAINAERENIKQQQKFMTAEKKAELDELESKRANFVHNETKKARDQFQIFDEQKGNMDTDRRIAQMELEESLKEKEMAAKNFNRRFWSYPEGDDWKLEPELNAVAKKVKAAKQKLAKLPTFPEDVYQRELGKLRAAKLAAEETWRQKYPAENTRLERIRAIYMGAKNSAAKSEKEIAKRVLARRLKAGFLGLGAVAGGAYLLGESTTTSVIESQDFKGKRAPAVVPESLEKAELVLPGI